MLEKPSVGVRPELYARLTSGMTGGEFLADATTLFNATPAKDDGTETP